MTYTGVVRPGGLDDTLELAHLTVRKVAVDPAMANNSYLLRCRHTGAQVMIDAAAEPERLIPWVGDAGLDAVITTHQHWDHHRALAEVVAATGGTAMAGAPDAAAITDATGVPIGVGLADGHRIPVGESELEVIALRGHTPGSVALLYDDPAGTPHLFTGDSLFPGGVGNTFGDAAAFAQLIDDVEQRVFARLPDATWLYPGHGDDSTLGAERPHLSEWRRRGW
ncbi:MAG: MBL fold metallo-hydrolase [Nocardioides sp.]|uniref:MBL fold metallo-hydrolase n=1 Tax=Nocardioides sp. TaxID=35761 RepID=UPI0039E312DD